jgi:hypothetical protein
MNSWLGYITVLLVGLTMIVVWWFNWNNIVFYADTPWSWVMIIVGMIAIHMFPIGISLYYLKGLGIWSY